MCTEAVECAGDPDTVGVARGVAGIKLAYTVVLLTGIPVVCA